MRHFKNLWLWRAVDRRGQFFFRLSETPRLNGEAVAEALAKLSFYFRGRELVIVPLDHEVPFGEGARKEEVQILN